MKKLLSLMVYFGLLSGNYAIAKITVEKIGELAHGENELKIVLNSSHDTRADQSCMHISFGGPSKGVTSETKCFPSNNKGRYEFEKLPQVNHSESTNITLFKIKERTTGTTCFANAISTELARGIDQFDAPSSLDLSIDCHK